MSSIRSTGTERRDFLKKAGLGVAAAGTLLTESLSGQSSVNRQPESEKLSRLALTLAAAPLVQDGLPMGAPDAERPGCGRDGEITMHDLPRTKTLPGHLPPDLWSDVPATRPTRRSTPKRPGPERKPFRPALNPSAPAQEVGRGWRPSSRTIVRVPAHLQQRAAVPAIPTMRSARTASASRSLADAASVLGPRRG